MTISDSHRQQLKASDIYDEVAAARRYRTIRRRSEVPDEFADWQRRLGLLVPTYSPNGKTAGYQLRPDKPIKRKNGDAPKYETPHGSRITLDVNPLMLEAVRHGDGELWITEGCKKVDSLASRGEPAVGFIGVWNMAVPKTKGAVPLPCWQHVRLRGRRVIIVFDADSRTNPDVEEALRRAVRMLERLGAIVLVVYLPAVSGDGKAGVDDYLAAGGTVAELRMMAGPYEPVDVGAERMGKDEKLRAGVEDLERRFWAEEWPGMGGASARDVYLKLIEAAKRSGKVVADGIRVVKAQGPLALEAKVSTRTLWKALNRLEEWGLIYRDNEGRKPDKSGAFVLCANVSHKGRKPGQEGGTTSEEGGYRHGDLHLRASRLRWSQPKWKPGPKTRRKYRLGEISRLPETRDRIERLGKIRGAIIDALDAGGGSAGGGSATVAELYDVLHPDKPSDKRRPRDLIRRAKSEKGRNGPMVMLEEAGIVSVDGNLVSLTDNWLEALEEQRWLGKEVEAEELAKRRYKLKSRAFHGRHEAPKSEPSPVSIAAVELSRVKRREYLDAHAGDTAVNTPSDAELVAMRRRVQRLVREGMARRFAEQAVYGPAASSAACGDPPSGSPDEPGQSAISARKMPRMVEGVYVHGAVCECEWCAA